MHNKAVIVVAPWGQYPCHSITTVFYTWKNTWFILFFNFLLCLLFIKRVFGIRRYLLRDLRRLSGLYRKAKNKTNIYSGSESIFVALS